MIGRWAQRIATAGRRSPAAYALVVAAVLAAAGLQLAAGLVWREPPLFVFLLPVVALATLGVGWRGGLLALAASAGIAAFVLLPRTLAGPAGPADQARTLWYVVSGLLVIGGIGALRRAIRRASATADRFRTAMHRGMDPFVIVEPILDGKRVVDFRWVYANPAADRSAPAGVQALTGRRLREAFPGPAGEEMVAWVARVLASGDAQEVETRRTLDGQERWLRSSGVSLGDAVAVSFRDITAQRLADQALRDAESQVRVLINSLPQLLWSSRADGYCDFFSPQWTRYTGLPAEQLYGAGWLETIHPDDRARVETVWRELVDGRRPHSLEYRIRARDGSWRWFSGRTSFARDEVGGVKRWYGSATDITEIVEARRNLEERVAERTRELQASLEERARAEASLAQAQRLETVGRLTGGVAHDFNNLLTVIIGGLDMILRRPEDSARVKRLGEAALDAGRRGERLTRQLLAFSRRQELKLEVTDVAALVQQLEPLLRRAVGEAVDMAVACDPEVGASRLDAAQFEAALMNLVVNAADATPPGGAIRVVADRVRLASGQVDGAAAGDYVRISVSDTGGGMSPEVRQRVFEPFFTTKEVGKGSGLGLAQVFGFVTQCGGAVAIDSALGEGTTVRLHLPLAPYPSAQAVEPSSAGPRESRLDARVLLVEDDPAVRAVTESLLLEMGCAVACEGEGHPALRRLESGEGFDVILSDMVMPGGMSGLDLARAVAALRPDLPVVLTTGYAGERGAPPDEIGWPVLRKPFNAEGLGQALRQALERAAGPG